MSNKFKILIIFLISTFLGGCVEIKNGEKVGQIVDLHQSGLLIKTWECKIIRGGLDDGTGTIGSSIWLTIEDTRLIEKAKNAMLNKKFVSVKYHEEAFSFLRSDSQSYFVDSINEVSDDLRGEKE